MHVWLELTNGLDGERVGDNLALTRVLSTIPHIEHAAVDADKGVVEGGFEKAIAVTVDFGYGGVGCNADVVGRDADYRAVLLVSLIDGDGAPSETGLPEEPEIAEFGEEGTGD